MKARLILLLGYLLAINAMPAECDEEGEEEEEEGGEETGDCPDEWTSIAGGCYKFLPEKYNWEDAKEACDMLRGWLVEIESEEQNDAIHDEAKKAGRMEKGMDRTD